MSELRVDNIVSEDGSAAPVYSKGMTIGAGQTLTCSGDFTVGGDVTFNSGATVTGVVTFSQTNLSTDLNVSGIVTATSFSGDGSALTGIDATTIVNGTSNVTVAENGNITATRSGTTRLTVTSSGINVTGSVTCDGMTSDGNGTFRATGTPILTLQDTGSTGAAASAVIQGTDSAGTQKWQIGDANGGNENLVITNAATANIEFASGGSTRVYVNSAGHFVPAIDDTYDLGGASLQWRNAYFDGTLFCDGFACDGAATIESGSGVLKVKDADSSSTTSTCYVEGTSSNDSSVWYIGHGTSSDSDLYVSNQVSGNIIFRTGSTSRAVLQSDGHFRPNANNTYDLGTSSIRWRNVYTNDLNLSNEGGANDVDGTWGSWTIQEGEDDLFLINRRSGKKYKFNLTEVN